MKNNRLIETLAIIPARGGSKGIPKKNITPICGKPLIVYTIEVAQNAQELDAAIVSTDSEQIAEVARSFGADVPFLRPADLASDTASDIGYLQHALEWVRKNRGWNPAYVVLLQPTSPTRTADDVDNVVRYLKETGADSVRTMIRPKCCPFKMWTDAGGVNAVEHLFPEYRSGIRRQDVKNYYMPVAIAYAMRSSCIDDGSMWGKDVRKVDFPEDRYTDIDTLDDLMHAESILQKFNINQK